jgi:hypothetical protein
MGNENTFLYKGHQFTFCGFYDNKFAFYFSGKVVFVNSIKELEQKFTILKAEQSRSK